MTSKSRKLKSILKGMKSVLIAYSGGVDSTFLLKVALDTLGKEKVFAVIAASETYPKSEKRSAEKTAKGFGANYKIIETCEFLDDNFRKNPGNRCYYCKSELFSKLAGLAKKMRFNCVADGSNADDLSDYRPGAKAKKETGVRSPLQEAGLTKSEIRKLSKKLSLSTWDKPSYACLASRIPYGTEITEEILEKIDRGEEFLRKLGFNQLRVRHHGDIVRIEVDREAIGKISANGLKEKIVKKFEELGYAYVTLDLKGYRAGSMNKALSGKGVFQGSLHHKFRQRGRKHFLPAIK